MTSTLDSSLPTAAVQTTETFAVGEETDPLLPIHTEIIYSQAAVSTALVFCILFILVGVSGNSLTIAALLKHKKLRVAATSIFIVSLSFTDLIFCLFNLPITALRYAQQRWVLGDSLCQMFPFFFYLNVAASLFSMMAITINRYVLIGHYNCYDRIYRKGFVALMILFCWGFPLALLLPTAFGRWGTFGYDEETFSCTILPDEKGSSPKKFVFLFGFFLPCLIIMICYVRIFLLVRLSRQNLTTYRGTRSAGTEKRQVDELSLTKMVLTIFTCFLLCYLPLMIVNVYDDDEAYPELHVLASILAWSASVLNPFIYAIMNRRYRKAYTALLPCAGCRRKIRAVGQSVAGRSSSNSATMATSTLSGGCGNSAAMEGFAGERPRFVDGSTPVLYSITRLPSISGLVDVNLNNRQCSIDV